MLVALVATVNAQETPKGDAYKGVLTIQLGEGETAGEPLELPDQTVYIEMNEDGTSCTFGQRVLITSLAKNVLPTPRFPSNKTTSLFCNKEAIFLANMIVSSGVLI